MKRLPTLLMTARARRDVRSCLRFVARQPWGKPTDREWDISQGYREICQWPKRNRVGARRRSTGIELRRQSAAQFAIVYAYMHPNATFPNGLVSIRAVRHRRVKNVFSGVRETMPPPYLADVLAMLGAEDIEFDPPRFQGPLPKPVDFI